MTVSAEDLLEMSGVETLHPGGFDLSRHIGELVRFTLATRVLDVSSGKGAFACLYAREFGSRITGVEINPRFVEMARKRAAAEAVTDRVEFKIGDSRNLPFQDEEFDVVVNECAVGLTAINAPQRVLDEMVRVAKKGGTVVIHENTWLGALPASERQEAAMNLGTIPYTVEEWKQMLIQAGAAPKVVEDWSGPENILKMRPDHHSTFKSPLDLFTAREKLGILAKVVSKYGLGSLPGLYAGYKKLYPLFGDGYLGYSLIVASKS